ncbi:MAG: methionine synthase [Halioglobus sp.]|nr:methionine synthase [Halioglobus sp.]
MSDQLNSERDEDGVADAVAATIVVAIAVFAMYLWLSGMPS